MTVSTTSIKAGPYSGNDVATAFAYTWRVESKTEVIVYETDDSDVVTTLTVDTDYTVSNIGVDGGGDITRVAGALPTGYTWLIASNFAETQETDFESQGAFLPAVHEAAFDKLTHLIQQLSEVQDRSLTVPPSLTGINPELPDPQGGFLLGWANPATELTNVTLGALTYGALSVETVDEMDAATLTVGMFVQTGGYHAVGDNGANLYEIVAASTGTDDGGTYIDLTESGLQAKGLFLDGQVNVKQFGAKGDGVTDDTTAIQSALDAYDVIYIPSGNYIVTSNLSKTGTVAIYGEGIGNTVLSCDADSGFTITGVVSDNNPTIFENLSIFQTAAISTTSAIKVDNSAQISGGSIQNRLSPRLLIQNVAIKGAASVTNSGWLQGVELISILHVYITGLHFEGRYDTTPDNILSTNAISISGSGDPVELLVENSWVFYANKAVHATDTEGVFVGNCNFVGVGTGIRFDPAGEEPQLDVHSCHINCHASAINSTNLNQGNIRGNLIYARNTAVADVAGIQFDNCSWTNVSQNVFVNTSSYAFNPIIVSNGGEGCQIEGNIFQSVTTAIWLKATASKVRIEHNTFGNVTNRILDQGSLNYVPSKNALLRRTTTYSLANSTLTAIPFESVLSGTSEYFDIANPTRLTAPITGIYEIYGMIVFPISGTGSRKAVLRRNGNAVIGYPQNTIQGSGVVNDAISLGAIRVELVAGDYIELHAYQDSGTALTIPVSETSLSLTFISELGE